MSLGRKLIEALERVDSPAYAPQQTLSVADGDLRLELDVAALDRMSCSFNELRLHLLASPAVPVEKLKHWADAVCKRVTYLLEQMGPLEVDPEAQQVLARSVPPQREPDRIRFYEVLFHSPGTLRLCRYESRPGESGRTRIEMQMTREIAEKLANDLALTVSSL